MRASYTEILLNFVLFIRSFFAFLGFVWCSRPSIPCETSVSYAQYVLSPGHGLALSKGFCCTLSWLRRALTGIIVHADHDDHAADNDLRRGNLLQHKPARKAANAGDSSLAAKRRKRVQTSGSKTDAVSQNGAYHRQPKPDQPIRGHSPVMGTSMAVWPQTA